MNPRWWVALGALVALSGCGETETVSAPSTPTRLVEAGWSFGFCLGPCNGRLIVENDALAYRVTSRTGDQLFADNRGRLTSSGAARLAGLVAALPETLQDTYGCPDCADAGAAYVVVSREDASERSTYEYPSPPAALASLDAFLKDLWEALGQCVPSGDVALDGACSPLPR